MKKFKAIYYPVIAAVMVLALVLGFVSGTRPMTRDKLGKEAAAAVRGHLEAMSKSGLKTGDTDAAEAAASVRDYIIAQLNKAGVERQLVFRQDEAEDQTLTFCDYQTSEGVKQPSFFVQNDKMTMKTAAKLPVGDDKTLAPVDFEVENIVVAIPGTKTLAGQAGDAVMLMAHYDAWGDTLAAGDNGISVAAMLELVSKTVGEKRAYENDLLFVFTDAKEDGLYGAFTFCYQFKGFDDVYARVKLGTNFDGLGKGGVIALSGTSANDYKLVDAYAKLGGAGSSAFSAFYRTKSRPSDFAVYDNVAAMDIVSVGNGNYYHSLKGNADDVTDADISARLNVMNNLLEAFGSYDLSRLKANQNGVYFSFLGLFNVAYSQLAAYIIGALLILMILAVIVAGMVKKAFSWSKLLVAAGVQLLTLASVFVALIVGFYLVAMLLVGFGVMPWHAISTVVYSNAGLILGVMLLAVAALAGFYALYKRFFGVKGVDLVRAAALLIALIGAVLSFVLPSVGYIFAFLGIFEMAVMLCTVFFKERYKQRRGEDIERLFLYTLPVIIVGIPLLIPVVTMVSAILPSVYICMTVLAFALMAATIMPYADFIKPAMNRAFAKLPKRTIRVEQVVTERIEDKAKKGKYTEKQVKKVSNEKVDWHYNHGVGVGIVALAAVVVMILTSAFGAGFGTVYAGSFDNPIYKDSLLYVWEKNNTSVSQTLEIHDRIAYKYMRMALGDMSFSGDKNAYVKEFAGNANSILSTTPQFSAEDGKINFKPYNNGGNSTIIVRLTAAKEITSVTVTAADGTETEFANAGNKEIEISLPYGDINYKSFELKIETTDTTVNVEYEQYVTGGQADNVLRNNLEEWQDIVNYYRDSKVKDQLKCGMILRYNQTVTL